MGTHVRTGYERHLRGSVAERVVRLAPTPVLTVAVGDIDYRKDAVQQRSPDTAMERSPWRDPATVRCLHTGASERTALAHSRTG